MQGRNSLASAIIASYQVDQGVVTIIDAVVSHCDRGHNTSQDHGGTVTTYLYG